VYVCVCVCMRVNRCAYKSSSLLSYASFASGAISIMVQTGQMCFIALLWFYCADRPDGFYCLAEALWRRCVLLPCRGFIVQTGQMCFITLQMYYGADRPVVFFLPCRGTIVQTGQLCFIALQRYYCADVFYCLAVVLIYRQARCVLLPCRGFIVQADQMHFTALQRYYCADVFYCLAEVLLCRQARCVLLPCRGTIVQTGQMRFITLQRFHCADKPDVFYYLAEVLLCRQASCVLLPCRGTIVQVCFTALQRYYCADRSVVFYCLGEVLLWRQARCVLLPCRGTIVQTGQMHFYLPCRGSRLIWGHPGSQTWRGCQKPVQEMKHHLHAVMPLWHTDYDKTLWLLLRSGCRKRSQIWGCQIRDRTETNHRFEGVKSLCRSGEVPPLWHTQLMFTTALFLLSK